MNCPLAEPSRWSRRQWCYGVAAVSVVQIGLLFYFDPRAPAERRLAPVPADIRAAIDPWSAQLLANLPTLKDPTLFALPNLKGFSGSAWIRYAPWEHRLSDWTDPPCGLALHPAWLGDRFATLAATNVIEPLQIGDKALPRPTGLDIPTPNEPFATESDVRVEGELAGRPLLKPPILRAWPSSELLSNTVVQLLVDAAGYPLATAIWAESGSREADQFALKQAAGARFAPWQPRAGTSQPSSHLAWGKMIFAWATVSPAATNVSIRRP